MGKKAFLVFILAGIHDGEMSDNRPTKRTMPSPVNGIFNVKSLRFHNLSASLCHGDKPASIHTSAEKPFFLPNMRGRRKESRESGIYSR